MPLPKQRPDDGAEQSGCLAASCALIYALQRRKNPRVVCKMASVAQKLTSIDRELSRLQDRKTELLASLRGFENRDQLMQHMYDLTKETARVDVLRCSVMGGKFRDYGDTREGWDYEVRFDYVLDDGEIYRVHVTDTRCFLMTKHSYQHIKIDQGEPRHHPAAVLFHGVLKGDAKTYAGLDRSYFPEGDPSWEGSCLEKYW